MIPFSLHTIATGRSDSVRQSLHSLRQSDTRSSPVGVAAHSAQMRMCRLKQEQCADICGALMHTCVCLTGVLSGRAPHAASLLGCFATALRRWELHPCTRAASLYPSACDERGEQKRWCQGVTHAPPHVGCPMLSAWQERKEAALLAANRMGAPATRGAYPARAAHDGMGGSVAATIGCTPPFALASLAAWAAWAFAFALTLR